MFDKMCYHKIFQGLKHMPLVSPSATYMCQWIRSALVQIMACPIRHQAIIWTIAGFLSIGLSGANFSDILIKIQNSWFTKMLLKLPFAKWRPFCPREVELKCYRDACQNAERLKISSHWSCALCTFTITYLSDIKSAIVVIMTAVYVFIILYDQYFYPRIVKIAWKDRIAQSFPFLAVFCLNVSVLLNIWPTQPCINVLQCTIHRRPLGNFACKVRFCKVSEPTNSCHIEFKHDVPYIVRSEPCRGHSDAWVHDARRGECTSWSSWPLRVSDLTMRGTSCIHH